MGLLSFLRREPAPLASADAPTRKRGKGAVQADHAEQVAQLRARARHRLIGAAVLVGAGVIAFPLVFETQPRPVPMDLPIVIPAQDAAPAVRITQAPPLPASLPEDAQPEAVQRDVNPPAESDPPASEPVLERPSERPPERTPARAPTEQVAERPSKPAKPDARPAAAVERATGKPADAAADKPRFVVQVGAFADKSSAQAIRNKLEAKGLKTYAQVAQTKDGERIRVRLGPFSDRAEAEKAAANAKAVGIAANVLTL